MAKQRLKVPKHAKEAAKRALDFNKSVTKSQRVGLTSSEAKREGIQSGIERAKQLINNETISYQDAQDVCRFKRFLGMKKTVRVEAAINLWGGEKFIKDACNHVRKYKEK